MCWGSGIDLAGDVGDDNVLTDVVSVLRDGWSLDALAVFRSRLSPAFRDGRLSACRVGCGLVITATTAAIVALAVEGAACVAQ